MKKSKHGFTIIEMLIVLTIVGILAAVAIPAYQDAMNKRQAQELKAAESGEQTAGESK